MTAINKRNLNWAMTRLIAVMVGALGYHEHAGHG